MTQDEVRDLIDKYIIKNSMGAITAVIMRPILEEILNQPNALIGNLEYLDTLEKTTIVDAINSIVNGQIVEINAKILELIEKDVEQDQRLEDIEIHDKAQDLRLDVIEQYDRDQDVRIEAIEDKDIEQDERLDNIENHDSLQDQRLDYIEQHDRDQDGRLDNIEAHDANQDVRLNLIEIKNEDQDEEIANIHLKNNAQDIQIADLQNKDIQQDGRLTDIENVNETQNNEIQNLKDKDVLQDDEIQKLRNKDVIHDTGIQSLKDKDVSQDADIQSLKDKDVLQDEEITDLDNRVDTLENKVATVYIPKGSVADITALFALTDQEIGWVYNLEDTGMNYVYLGGTDGDQGNGWDSLGGWVDFSEYYTRLEVDAKIDAMDLQKVTDIGNTTTNDINIISEDAERLAVLDSDDIILSDLTTGKNTTLSNAGGNSILEHTDNGITNGLSINKDKTVFTKVVQGVDAEDNLDFTTLQQVTDLIEQGGGDVEVGFGLSKNEDGSIRLGKEIEEGGMILNNIEIGDDYFIIGKIDIEDNLFGNIAVLQDIHMAITSNSPMNITSSSTMQIGSGSSMNITSKNTLNLGSVDINNSMRFLQSFGVNEYTLSEPNGNLIKYVIGDEFIEFSKRIKGVDAIEPNELTTLNQVKEMIEVKDFILSPDGSKWGIDDTGNTYKLT